MKNEVSHKECINALDYLSNHLVNKNTKEMADAETCHHVWNLMKKVANEYDIEVDFKYE
jgi:hypothetical protein